MSAADLNQLQIKELSTLLKSRQLELQSQLENSSVTTQPVTLDQQSVGRVSRIDAIQQQQMAIASQQQVAQQLQFIQRALRLIAEGEYGFCYQCGEGIAFARLQVQPAARLCIECQSANEAY